MSTPRISVRMLCLLTLVQLVIGPMVLVTIFSFAKVTVREAPTQGLAKAMSSAWQSPEVQMALQVVQNEATQDGTKPAPSKVTTEKTKLFGIAWSSLMATFVVRVCQQSPSQCLYWTPAWPQAPPDLPPRLG